MPLVTAKGTGRLPESGIALDAKRKGLAIFGLVFVVLFVIQGVIVLTRSSVSYGVTHVRVHRTSLAPCASSTCGTFSPPSGRYLVTFVVSEDGATSRPTCTVMTTTRKGSARRLAAMVPASGGQALWLGSAVVDGPYLGLSSRVVKIGCR